MPENVTDCDKLAEQVTLDHAETKRQVSPGLAGILGFITPGAGHFYGGSHLVGACLFIAYSFGLLLVIVAFCEWNAAPWNAMLLYVFVFFRFWSMWDAIRTAKKNNAGSQPCRLGRLIKWLVILLLLITFEAWGLLLRNFVAQSFKIPSEAMKNTLLVGDHLVADKYTYLLRKPQRGDVVVFLFPNDITKTYVKRIIGMPGDSIEVERPIIRVNGQLLDEPYAVYRSESYNDRGHQAFQVPQEAFFVLGDNRDNSEDSRHWGFLPQQLIIGKLSRVYFSWDVREFDNRMQSRSLWEVPFQFLLTIRWSRTGTSIE